MKPAQGRDGAESGRGNAKKPRSVAFRQKTLPAGPPHGIVATFGEIPTTEPPNPAVRHRLADPVGGLASKRQSIRTIAGLLSGLYSPTRETISNSLADDYRSRH